MSKVSFVQHGDVVLRQIAANSEETLQQAGRFLVEAVQEKMLYGYHDVHGNPPHTEIVDTGRLFDSIMAEVRKESQNAYGLEISANTRYAQYVHEGTHKLKGRPFITDAFMDNLEELKTILTNNMGDGF